VFASLIVPALAAKRFAEGARLGIGYGVGLAGYVLDWSARRCSICRPER